MHWTLLSQASELSGITSCVCVSPLVRWVELQNHSCNLLKLADITMCFLDKVKETLELVSSGSIALPSSSAWLQCLISSPVFKSQMHMHSQYVRYWSIIVHGRTLIPDILSFGLYPTRHLHSHHTIHYLPTLFLMCKISCIYNELIDNVSGMDKLNH